MSLPRYSYAKKYKTRAIVITALGRKILRRLDAGTYKTIRTHGTGNPAGTVKRKRKAKR